MKEGVTSTLALMVPSAAGKVSSAELALKATRDESPK